MSKSAYFKQEELIAELSIWNMERARELSENAPQDTLNDNEDNCVNSATHFNYIIRRLLPPRGNRFRHDHHDTCMYIERSKNANVVAYTANLLNKETEQRVENSATASCACVFDEHNPIHAYFLKIDEEYVRERRKQGITYDQEELNLIERKLAYGCNVSQLINHTAIRKALQKSDKFQNYMYSHIKEKDSSKEIHRKEDVDSTVQWWDNWQPHVMSFVALPHHLTLLLRLPPLNQKEVEMINKLQHNLEKVSNTKLRNLTPRSNASEGMLFTDTVVVILTMINDALCILDHAYVKSVEPKHFYQLPSVEYIELYGVSLNTFEPAYMKIAK